MKVIKESFKAECPVCFSKLEFNFEETVQDLNKRTVACPVCSKKITVFEDEKWLVEHGKEDTDIAVNAANYSLGYSLRNTIDAISYSPNYSEYTSTRG